MDWITTLTRLGDERRPCAQVVVIDSKGSAPREVGARMIVADGRLVQGTIGGGRLEHVAIERATELIGEGEAVARTEAFPLSEKVGQCCGGEVTLYFETYHWTKRSLVVFGAGHVAQAVAGLGAYMDLGVQLIDPRSEDEIEPKLPADRDYDVLFIDSPEEEVDTIAPDSLVLVMTHDHALDLAIIERALKRGVFPYVGLIGSERKWIRFKHRLAQRGFSEEQIATVTCPIGLTKGSKEPRKIALSVAAQLVDVAARLSALTTPTP